MKPVHWLGSTLDDLRHMPDVVQDEVGHALYLAQTGGKHAHAKALKGFKGASVLEIVESHDGETYRAVYTVKIKIAIYVLHVFHKKSKRGTETPKPDMDLIRQRLKEAIDDAKGDSP